MPPHPIINDALWRCLCPRYSQVAIGLKKAPRNGPSRSTVTIKANSGQIRPYNDYAPASDKPVAGPKDYFSTFHAPSSTLGPRRSLKEQVPLVHLPLPDLYERLRYDGAAGRYEEVMHTIRILIKDRRERPNVQMYTAVLHSYANCQEGTAGKLGKVLDEMETAGVELDGRGSECVLEALAVHPDYLLRTDILEYMKARWFNLSDRAQNFVVAGMLRDRCFEQALEKLDDMIRERTKVEGWLWDKTMWMLLEYGEVEEALHILSLRQNTEGPGARLSTALWQILLDAAAKRHLAEATATIWNTRVQPGYLKPPTGTCIDTLSVAARSGDVKLATDVFRVLAERGITLTSHHYEALMESYLNNDDLYAALTVIFYMHDSVLKISPDALHPLFSYLKQKEERPMEAFILLQGFNDKDKKKVPVVAVNTCIHAASVQGRLAEAIDIYKALHTVCKAGPNTHTFNILLGGCQRQGRKELAMFLASEMIQLNRAPDRLTYDRLMLICMDAAEINDALLYYEEMKEQGFEPRRTTHEMLIKKSVNAGDARAVAVVKDYAVKPGADKGRVAMFERLVWEKFEDKRAEIGSGEVDGLEGHAGMASLSGVMDKAG
jgi:pentatricopeptide repeat protein